MQIEFHDLLTQAAEANEIAGSLARMFWRRSSFSEPKSPAFAAAFASFEGFAFELRFDDEGDDDDDDDGISITVVQFSSA